MSGAVQRRRVGGGDRDDVEARGAGSRIAVDPEEERRVKGEAARPALTLMEEVLLLGLKDEQGTLSFWNDNLPLVLRGCILLELALQGKIAMINLPQRRQFPLSERKIEVIDDRLTGEVLLDETIQHIKNNEAMSVPAWIMVLSGETWSLSKISLQLKQVRERLSKGLVDKGICRTEKMSFILFDMATHPIVNTQAKRQISQRVQQLLGASTFTPEYRATQFFPRGLPYKTLRTVALVASSYAGNVLENLYSAASYDARDAAYLRVDELLNDYSEYPFAANKNSAWGSSVFRAVSAELAAPDHIADPNNAAAPASASPSLDTQMEVVAAVFRWFLQLDEVL